MNNKLALFGGKKTIDHHFKKYNSIGLEEVEAASNVVRSGVLSKFVGAWGQDFLGGDKVREFERACERYFDVKHAITVNSWTSGLIAAVGAIGVEPGDEIIVTPWTMCASATAILHWNAIPVFADIDPDSFNLNPVSIKKNITKKTKAIMSVDIFGQSSNMKVLRQIADEYGLKIISDTAQAPGSMYGSAYSGTLADIGGYSLNYHKHIHTGEGGILVTNDDTFAKKLQLIRNHAEAAIENSGIDDITNMLGYNFRLGEIEAAIGIEQLKKLGQFTKRRQEIGKLLITGLGDLKGLRTPETQEDCTHVYYIFPMVLDINKIGVSRQRIYEALLAEGVEGIMQGYANVHLLPIFQKKIAYGSKGFPWTGSFARKDISYTRGICPVAEELHSETFIGYEMCLNELSNQEVGLIIKAFKKVWDNLDALR